MFRKALLVLVVVIMTVANAFAEDASVSSLLVSDIPITYGDEAFRERILERTRGARDPIGLVLTGGSARAVAHLGVLEYLEENGIVPLVLDAGVYLTGDKYLTPENEETDVMATSSGQATFNSRRRTYTFPFTYGYSGRDSGENDDTFTY